MVNQDYPLTFFHFSSFDSNSPSKLSRRPFRDKFSLNKAVKILSQQYRKKIDFYKNYSISDRYTFDFMSDGSYISPTLRRAYASKYHKLSDIEDPFIYSGAIKDFLNKNYLHTFSAPYISMGYQNKGSFKFLFRIINFNMRILLKILGPNKFMNFSRLLVYLSSYRQNSDLWKL